MTYNVICAWCGKIIGTKRDDQPESSEPASTHSICPECKRQILAELNPQQQEGELS